MVLRFAGIALSACLLSACATGTPVTSAAPDELNEPLAAGTADPVAGQRLFVAREGGHCVLCHQVSGLDAAFQGNLGPGLDGIGTRLNTAQIRLRVVDSSLLNPDTIMPAYYRTEGLEQVAGEYRGKTVLTGQQVEDIVAWLATLRGDEGDAGS